MIESVRVYAQVEIDAVKSGEIKGDYYSDGEVWAQWPALLEWREKQTERAAQ